MRCRLLAMGLAGALGLVFLAGTARAGGHLPAPQKAIPAAQSIPSPQGECAPCVDVCYEEPKHCFSGLGGHLSGLKCKLGGLGSGLKCKLGGLKCKLSSIGHHKQACAPVVYDCGTCATPSPQGVYASGQGTIIGGSPQIPGK